MAGRGYNLTMLDGAMNRASEAPMTWAGSWWQGDDTDRLDPATWRAFGEVLRAARNRGVHDCSHPESGGCSTSSTGRPVAGTTR